MPRMTRTFYAATIFYCNIAIAWWTQMDTANGSSLRISHIQLLHSLQKCAHIYCTSLNRRTSKCFICLRLLYHGACATVYITIQYSLPLSLSICLSHSLSFFARSLAHSCPEEWHFIKAYAVYKTFCNPTQIQPLPSKYCSTLNCVASLCPYPIFEDNIRLEA